MGAVPHPCRLLHALRHGVTTAHAACMHQEHKNHRPPCDWPNVISFSQQRFSVAHNGQHCILTAKSQAFYLRSLLVCPRRKFSGYYHSRVNSSSASKVDLAAMEQSTGLIEIYRGENPVVEYLLVPRQRIVY